MKGQQNIPEREKRQLQEVVQTRESQVKNETQVWKPEGNQAGRGKDGRQGSDRLAGLKQR